MTILFICDEYPPGKNGGIGTVVQVLGRELVKQGHRVIVAGLYRYRYGGKDFEIDQGVEVWRKRFGLNLNLHENHRLYNLLEKSPASIRRNLNGKKAFKKFISFIVNVIDKEGVEVIEIPDWNNFTFFIGFTVKWPNFKAPLVLKSHGSYTKICHDFGKKPKKIVADTDAFLYKRADAITAVSDHTAEISKKIFKPNKKIKTLYNGIEVSSTQPALNRMPRKVVFTGTLIPAKGIFQLIKAWNGVANKYKDAELLIFGKGKTSELKKLISKEAISSVKFMGHVPREVLFNELANATLAVFPSYSETFGLAVVEAMSTGCPVIFTKRSCGPEIIQDGENGVLIDPDNVEEIAANIINLIENKDLQEKYSKNGRATALTKFNISNSATEHIRYYQEVIKQFKQLHP